MVRCHCPYQYHRAITLFLIFIFLLAIISTNATADDEGELEEGGFHVILMLVAGLLGLLAAASGMRNSRLKAISNLFPKEIPRIIHRYVSIAYYLVFFGTFIAWSFAYFGEEGKIYFTTHGQLGLASVIMAVIGIITGTVMMNRPVKLWRLHWVANFLSFALFIITVLLGFALED